MGEIVERIGKVRIKAIDGKSNTPDAFGHTIIIRDPELSDNSRY